MHRKPIKREDRVSSTILETPGRLYPSVEECAKRLLDAFREHKQLRRSQCYLFFEKLPAYQLTTALTLLREKGLIRSVVQRTAGRPLELWSLVDEGDPK